MNNFILYTTYLFALFGLFSFVATTLYLYNKKREKKKKKTTLIEMLSNWEIGDLLQINPKSISQFLVDEINSEPNGVVLAKLIKWSEVKVMVQLKSSQEVIINISDIIDNYNYNYRVEAVKMEKFIEKQKGKTFLNLYNDYISKVKPKTNNNIDNNFSDLSLEELQQMYDKAIQNEQYEFAKVINKAIENKK